MKSPIGRFGRLGRQYGVALRAMLVLTIALGIIYPVTITGIAQLTMPRQANGSTVRFDGRVMGSSLIGESFSTERGRALAQWFQPRPANAGYDGQASGGSNLGPNNPTLVKQIKESMAAIEKTDGVSASQIPPDALTASASGLDPQISPEYALLQVHRVADTRGLNVSTVKALVTNRIQGRDLGFLGESTVNVLELNIALARLNPAGNG